MRRLLRLVRRRLRSLRTRFGLWVAALVLVACVAFGVYVYVDMAGGLRSALDRSLQVSASLAASTLTVNNGQMLLGESLPTDNNQMEVLFAQGDTVRYLDPTGAVMEGFGLMRNAPIDAGALAAASDGSPAFANTSDHSTGNDYRLFTLAVIESGKVAGFVQVMHDFHSVHETMERLLASLLAGGAFIVVVAGLLGYLLVGRALAPINAITTTARHISAKNLSARLSLSGVDDEVGRLASTFDDMLERLDESFQRERRFTADASHELRTPLAAMEAILAVVRSERRRPDEYEQALDDLAEETGRLRNLVEDLLLLARGSQLDGARFLPVDISALVTDVVDALRPLADEKGLAVACHVEPGLTIQGDGDSLIRLLLNVVENAIKFTEHGGVTVSARSKQGSVVVEVSDTGVGIAQAELAMIFERFHRADGSRSTPGAGLGLSLAKQIVDNHGGTLGVVSREGVGSSFTITLAERETITLAKRETITLEEKRGSGSVG